MCRGHSWTPSVHLSLCGLLGQQQHHSSIIIIKHNQEGQLCFWVPTHCQWGLHCISVALAIGFNSVQFFIFAFISLSSFSVFVICLLLLRSSSCLSLLTQLVMADDSTHLEVSVLLKGSLPSTLVLIGEPWVSRQLITLAILRVRCRPAPLVLDTSSNVNWCYINKNSLELIY